MIELLLGEYLTVTATFGASFVSSLSSRREDYHSKRWEVQGTRRRKLRYSHQGGTQTNTQKDAHPQVGKKGILETKDWLKLLTM